MSGCLNLFQSSICALVYFVDVTVVVGGGSGGDSGRMGGG